MPCSVNDCVKPDLESKVPIAERLPWGVAEPLIAEAEVCATGAILTGTLEPPNIQDAGDANQAKRRQNENE